MDHVASARHDERLDRLERTIQQELIPRMVASHRVHAGARPADVSLMPAARVDVETFVRMVRDADEHKATTYVWTLLDQGVAVDVVYLELLAPAARRLGVMWESDECDFVEVTVALGRMQRLLRDLSQLFLADARLTEPVGHILLTCVAGEQHTLGIIMAGEFLIRDGWRVQVGAPWSEHDLLSSVGAEWFDVVGFSVGCEGRLSAVTREIRRVKAASRNPNLQVMVGGPAFEQAPELATQVGAHVLVTSAKDAPRLARTLLSEARVFAPNRTRRASPGEHGQFIDAPRRA